MGVGWCRIAPENEQIRVFCNLKVLFFEECLKECLWLNSNSKP